MALDVTDYDDLPALIRALKDLYHHGKLWPMAEKTGLSYGTLQQWEKRTIRHPTPPTLRLLSAAYGLDFNALINLATPPPPPPRKGRRMARAIRGGSGGIDALPIAQVVEKMSLIRRWLWGLAQPLLLAGCPA